MNPNIRPADRCLYSQDDFTRDSGLHIGYWPSERRHGEWVVLACIVLAVAGLVAWYWWRA